MEAGVLQAKTEGVILSKDFLNLFFWIFIILNTGGFISIPEKGSLYSIERNTRVQNNAGDKKIPVTFYQIVIYRANAYVLKKGEFVC